MDKGLVLIEIVGMIQGFPEKDKNDIREFIEHNEWGITLETVCSVIFEEKILINKQTYQKIVDIGDEMEMDPTLWNNISNLIR